MRTYKYAIRINATYASVATNMLKTQDSKDQSNQWTFQYLFVMVT